MDSESGGHSPPGRGELPAYYFSPQLPGTISEASRLLDANITKGDHQQNPDDDWYSAIKNRQLCRIPAFRRSFELACNNHSIAINQETVFRALLVARTRVVAGRIPGAGQFAPDQLKFAINHGNLIFERAVPLVFAFNQIIVEEINRLRAASPEESPQEAELMQALLPLHCVSIACFYFTNIRPAYNAAVATRLDEAALIGELARDSGQPYDVVIGLFSANSKWNPRSPPDREMLHCATYPTARRLYKLLESIPQARDRLQSFYRDTLIQRLHVATGRKTALPNERIEVSKRISRPPYHWDEPDNSDSAHPSP